MYIGGDPMSPRIKPATTNITQDRVRYGKAFGACAPTYELARCGYPASLINDVERFAADNGLCSILEVGAGSGKATIPVAKMRVVLDCIEPSRRMSGILRAKCVGFPNVTVLTTTFERWRPRGRYCLLVAAQSWHLIDPDVRLAKAAQVLRPGGTLALFWNQPPHPVGEQARRILSSILSDWGLDLSGPLAGRQAAEPSIPPFYSSPDFVAVSPRTYSTSYRLTFSWYIDVLRTYPEYCALGHSAQQRLNDHLRSTVFGNGYIDGGHYTTLHLARRAPADGQAYTARDRQSVAIGRRTQQTQRRQLDT
jgi:SAM-dependent methyltransferase